MKLKIATPKGVFGPYNSVETLQDRYKVNGGGELPFTVVGEGTVSEWDLPDPVPVLDPQPIRNERNQLLLASDWTQVADAPVDKAAWATYRQALRDITVQEGFPHKVVWPTSP